MTSTQLNNSLSPSEQPKNENDACDDKRKRKPVISMREAQTLSNWYATNLSTNEIDAHEGSAFWILNHVSEGKNINTFK